MIPKFKPNNSDGYETENYEDDIAIEKISPKHEEKKQQWDGVDVSWCNSPFVKIPTQTVSTSSTHTWFTTTASSSCSTNSSMTTSVITTTTTQSTPMIFPTTSTVKGIMTTDVPKKIPFPIQHETKKDCVLSSCEEEEVPIWQASPVSSSLAETSNVSKTKMEAPANDVSYNSILDVRPLAKIVCSIDDNKTVISKVLSVNKSSLRFLRKKFFQKCNVVRNHTILLHSPVLMEAFLEFEKRRRVLFFSGQIDRTRAETFIAEIENMNRALQLLKRIDPSIIQPRHVHNNDDDEPSVQIIHVPVCNAERSYKSSFSNNNSCIQRSPLQTPTIMISTCLIFVCWMCLHYLFRPAFLHK